MATRRADRIARNESAFRALNESLEASVHRGRPRGDFAGFVCECGSPECDDTVRLDLPTYESIRQDARLFFLLPGHDAPDVEDVVDNGDGYVVVRKHEDVVDIVEQTHPRREKD
ncbi:MAG: hypothetical protein LC744_00500 [Chloroflexi bacterium]|nr:hypothetical protein [Chloroflexota bacterium]